MKLDPKPFELIKSKEKKVELRLNDAKRQKLAKGDDILFISNANENEKIAVTIKGLHKYPSFAELFTYIEPELCGYDPGTTVKEAVNEMRKYYSEEQETNYGVVGIEVAITDLEFVMRQLEK